MLCYLREFEGEAILCIANVSRTAQAVELDLSEFAGRTPVELQLGDAAGFSLQGFIESFDNKLDPNTGSIIMRAS